MKFVLAVLNHRFSPEEKEKHPGGKSNDDTMYAVVSLHPKATAPASQAATEEMMSARQFDVHAKAIRGTVRIRISTTWTGFAGVLPLFVLVVPRVAVLTSNSFDGLVDLIVVLASTTGVTHGDG